MSGTTESLVTEGMPGAAKWNWQNVGLIVTGLIPLLFLLGDPPQTMPLIYTSFVIIYFLREPIARAVTAMPGHPLLKLIPLGIISGWLVEVFAWGNNRLAEAVEPVLFHPQLIPDLLLSIGVYTGWMLTWIAAFYFLRIGFRAAWLTMGFFGIFMENRGAVALAIWELLPTAPHMAALFAIYVFAVYGSWLGIAVVTVKDIIPIVSDDPQHWSYKKALRYLRYPIVLFVLFFMGMICADLFGSIWVALDLIPEKKSIVDYPFY